MSFLLNDSNDSNFSPFNTKHVLFLGGGKTYSEDCKRFFNWNSKTKDVNLIENQHQMLGLK